MNIETLKEILTLVAPIIAHICVAVVAIVKIAGHHNKKEDEANNKVVSVASKTEKAYKDIAILKTKIASIEKCLLEERRK